MKLLLPLLFLFLSVAAQAQSVHIFSDTEGSMAAIEGMVEHGKLRWTRNSDGSRRLELVNPKDSLVFVGDLTGPNWQDSNKPRNIELLDVLLDFKERNPDKLDIVLGNHDANKLKFIRMNAMINKGQEPAYKAWLAANKKIDSTHSRVFYWAQDCYGVGKDGVPGPISWYQKELQNRMGRTVSVEEASRRLAQDMRVGQTPAEDGRIVRFIKAGVESSIRSGFVFVHSPIGEDALGIIPGRTAREKIVDMQKWLQDRSANFFLPERERFFQSVKEGKVPSDILPNLADARWDDISKTVISDSASLQYADRPKSGDQLRGVHTTVAEAILRSGLFGIVTGHKPSGHFPGLHRIMTSIGMAMDIDVDISRGEKIGKISLSLLPSNEVEVTMTNENGRIVKTVAPISKPSPIGMVTEDGYSVKFKINDHYVAERYKGYAIEMITIPEASIPTMHLKYATVDRQQDATLIAKQDIFKKAVLQYGGEVFENDEVALDKMVRGRTLIQLLGASDWAALPQSSIDELKRQLIEFRKTLDPSKVVIVTGGNRAQNPNAFESLVHDVFGDMFDIVGFSKSDVPANEVDPKVKYINRIGNGENWDGPAQAAVRYIKDRRGVTILVGGGGVIGRLATSKAAAEMKDRLYMFQGYGGSSESKLAESGGVPLHTFKELSQKLKVKYPTVFDAPKTPRIGIYTGSFDPIHENHRKIIEGMLELYDLDKIYVVPDKTTDYKPGMLPLSERNEMIRLEFEGNPRIAILTQEMQTELGKGEMWDVMRVVMKGNPGAEFFSLMGTDTFNWYKTVPKENRPSNITLLVNNRDRTTEVPRSLDGAPVKLVDLGQTTLSSTVIRKALAAGEQVEGLSKQVLNYIRSKGLYGSKPQTGRSGDVSKQQQIQVSDRSALSASSGLEALIAKIAQRDSSKMKVTVHEGPSVGQMPATELLLFLYQASARNKEFAQELERAGVNIEMQIVSQDGRTETKNLTNENIRQYVLKLSKSPELGPTLRGYGDYSRQISLGKSPTDAIEVIRSANGPEVAARVGQISRALHAMAEKMTSLASDGKIPPAISKVLKETIKNDERRSQVALDNKGKAIRSVETEVGAAVRAGKR